MASLTIGPVDRTPDHATNEFQYAFIKLAQTAVLVSAGNGKLHTVQVGVAGTTAKFFDIVEGDTPADANQIATVDLAQLETHVFDIGFSKGLTVVVTGAAELTVSFRGTQMVAALTFGV